MVRKSFILLVSAIGVSLVWAAPEGIKQKSPNARVLETSGHTEIHLPTVFLQPPYRTLDDYVGTVYTAGTTEYDNQHNGTCGKMIDVDPAGVVSVAWTNMLFTDSRCVYVNLWDPVLGSFVYDSVGIRINASERCGYVAQTLCGNFFCFAYHCVGHTTVSMGLAGSQPSWCYEEGAELEIMWPKVDADINGVVHLISTESPAGGEPQAPMRIYYSRGVPVFDPDGFPIDIQWRMMSCGGFELFDSVMVISPDIACSRHSERCAIAWCYSMDDLSDPDARTPINNEIHLRISEDGGLNWGDPTNVTQWTPWDPDCYHSGGDPLECDRDTLRCYTDLAILFDESDNVHLAFTTTGFWWYLPGEVDSGFSDGTKSLIYHWSEETGYYSLVANGWHEAYEPGIWQRNVQRPSLAIDTLTGHLYCSYMRYDTTTCSESGFPMADAFVTVSTNNGCSWAAGTNVTNTTPDINPVPTGASMHERDVTVAPLVTDGFLHMEYVLDKDAGSMMQGEGVVTLNPVLYQRIPVHQITISPLLPEYPMHFDSAGFPQCESGTFASQSHFPEHFLLFQNYPNPFNLTTTLQFDLRRPERVTLTIYNVLGQEVARLLNDEWFSAGVHPIRFDGSNLASGVYIYSLISDGHVASKKMVLMK